MGEKCPNGAGARSCAVNGTSFKVRKSQWQKGGPRGWSKVLHTLTSDFAARNYKDTNGRLVTLDFIQRTRLPFVGASAGLAVGASPRL